MVLGTCIVGVSLLLLLIPSIAVIFGFLGVCSGLFSGSGTTPGRYTGGDVDSAFFWSPCSDRS